jgi:predicted ester cyclase
MSRENVDRYTQFVDAWNGGDIDRLLAFVSDGVEVSPFLAVVEGGYRGHDGVRRWRQDYYDTIPDMHGEIEDLRAIDDATLARLRIRGHGRDSGAPVDQLMWHVARWREGMMFRLSGHGSEPEALKAVGPEE